MAVSSSVGLARCDAALRAVENVMVVFAGAALALAMLLVSADAILRHLFAAPLTFQFTFTESYLMVMALAMALPWGYRTGGRIRVNLLIVLASSPVRAGLMRFANIITLPYLAVLAWTSAGQTFSAFRDGDVTMGVVDWPVGWSWVWVPVGLSVLCLRLLLDTFGDMATPDAEAH